MISPIKSMKIVIDTLLIAIAYLFIKSYINGYFISIFVLINYASTIFIESIIFATIFILVIKFIKKIYIKRKG